MSAMPGATKETYSLSGCSPEVCAEPGEAEKAPEGRKGDMGMGRNWVSNDANEHKKPMNPYESLWIPGFSREWSANAGCSSIFHGIFQPFAGWSSGDFWRVPVLDMAHLQFQGPKIFPTGEKWATNGGLLWIGPY